MGVDSYLTDIVLLHLWRGSERFSTNNQFQMSDQTAQIRSEQEMFARSNGTMERFRVRIKTNDSTTMMSFTFQINGIIKQTIGPILIGQTGVFLPSNQLPLSFLKDDLLVMQITNFSSAVFSDMEWGIDLKFVASP